MRNFEIESIKDRINFGKTKEYFEEAMNLFIANKAICSSVFLQWRG